MAVSGWESNFKTEVGGFQVWSQPVFHIKQQVVFKKKKKTTKIQATELSNRFTNCTFVP
jgi:queuine/archaeosine tRNA-ribosyltransferase